MNKEIFDQVAEEFTDYVADYYDSGFEDAPEDINNPEGFLGLFQNYLEGIVEQDPSNDNIEMYQHVLDHFDEVGVEDINEGIDDEPMLIPVIEDNSTARYMDGQ